MLCVEVLFDQVVCVYVSRVHVYRCFVLKCTGVHEYIATWKTGRVYRWGLRSRVKLSAVEIMLPSMGIGKIQ